MITNEQLRDLLDDAFDYMAERCERNAARAADQLASFMAVPAYARKTEQAKERKLHDTLARWSREAAWMRDNPEAFLSIELVFIPAHVGAQDAEETLARLAEAGSHLPVVGLVLAEA